MGYEIKALVVDDSAVSRMLLVHLLNADPRIKVIGEVQDGHTAVNFVQANKPDVVLMDIQMPGLDGFEATRLIMETEPVPIVICTANANSHEVANAFRLLEVGAVACVAKPVAPEHPDFAAMSQHLLRTVRLMSEVRVVRRWPRSRTAPALRSATSKPALGSRIVGIGASTGGPPVLQSILSGLPKNFPAPVLIVQHISHGFLSGLVEWLNESSALSVQVAAHGVMPLPGHAYLAPDDFHLGVNIAGALALSRDEAENGLRPAVAHLFRSLAQFYGSAAVGVLLTGMGKDGARELKQLRDCGCDTIAQDRDSSVVHGMPGEAIALGGAGQVLPADKIAGALLALVNSKLAKGMES